MLLRHAADLAQTLLQVDLLLMLRTVQRTPGLDVGVAACAIGWAGSAKDGAGNVVRRAFWPARRGRLRVGRRSKASPRRRDPPERVRWVRGRLSWLGSAPACSYLRAVRSLIPARAADWTCVRPF